MRKIVGINPDFADNDELDMDALEAVEEFQEGQITYDELRALVGPETASMIKDQVYPDYDPESFFDDPESL